MLLEPVSLRTSFCPLMMLPRLAVGLEPLNALDVAHRSPRSAEAEFGSPVCNRKAAALSGKKNCREAGNDSKTRQAEHRFMQEEIF
jgi:hypothetical protein